MSTRVQVYTTRFCSFCRQAKELLTRKGIAFDEIDVTADDEKREWLVAETGRRTVPQIFIDGKAMGGFEELRSLDQRGELDFLVR